MKKTIFLSVFSFLFFISCQKEENDPCAILSCYNSTGCIDGHCQCLPGFVGDDCSIEKIPIQMHCGKIEVTSFNAYDENGDTWDIGNGPDIYLKVSRVNEFSTGFYEDMADASCFFDVNWDVEAPVDTYIIRAYDYDYGITEDDYIGGISFKPYVKGLAFPQELEIKCEGCPVSFKIKELTYSF